jgi:hypothetical protein
LGDTVGEFGEGEDAVGARESEMVAKVDTQVFKPCNRGDGGPWGGGGEGGRGGGAGGEAGGFGEGEGEPSGKLESGEDGVAGIKAGGVGTDKYDIISKGIHGNVRDGGEGTQKHIHHEVNEKGREGVSLRDTPGDRNGDGGVGGGVGGGGGE